MNALHLRLNLIACTLATAAICAPASAADLPRVMFVSGSDAKPVIIDADGRQIPAAKGVVLQPGFTVKVPEGATLQLMTPEKGVVAVRPGSLVKLEAIGGTVQPYRLKLTQGGVRVANAAQAPRKYEITTPNARMLFDRGDHEAFFMNEGKLPDGRWGTFVRGFKEDSVLSARGADMTITRSDVGFVPGNEDEKVQRLPRVIVGAGGLRDPVSFGPGARAIGTTEMVANFGSMADQKPSGPVDASGMRTATFSGGAIGPLATLPAGTLKAGPTLQPVVKTSLALPPSIDSVKVREIKLLQSPTGATVPVVKDQTSITVMATDPAKSQTVTYKQVENLAPVLKSPPKVCISAKPGTAGC